jgi:hypothetical protein
MNELCSVGDIFQVPIPDLSKWKPLHTHFEEKPYNCAPTGLCVMNIITRNDAQKLGYYFDDKNEKYDFKNFLYTEVDMDKKWERGATNSEIINILLQELPTLNLNDIQINSVENLPDYISKYLKNGHITFIALFKLDKEKNESFIYDGHIVNFAKNKSGEVALLEGQNGKIYKGEEIVDYLKKYNGFFVYCESKKKRRNNWNPQKKSNEFLVGKRPSENLQTERNQRRIGRRDFFSQEESFVRKSARFSIIPEKVSALVETVWVTALINANTESIALEMSLAKPMNTFGPGMASAVFNAI